MDHNPVNWGRPRNDIYGEYDYSIHNAGKHDASPMMAPHTHTQSPIVTGTSVIAIKFDKGVIMAADNLGTFHFLQGAELRLHAKGGEQPHRLTCFIKLRMDRWHGSQTRRD